VRKIQGFAFTRLQVRQVVFRCEAGDIGGYQGVASDRAEGEQVALSDAIWPDAL
jgi:hypothetical protein